MFLAAEEYAGPEQFALDDPRDDAPDLVGYWLSRTYGFTDVEVRGWRDYEATSGSVKFWFDGNKYPPAIGYLLAMEIVAYELDKAGQRSDGNVVSRAEMIQLLKGWENPHAAADHIIHTRSLAS